MNTKWYSNFTASLPDPIMRVNLDYIADTRPNKINAGIGMIMDPKTNKPFVSTVLKHIGKEIAFNDNGYLPSNGHKGYLLAHGQYLIFGTEIWDNVAGSLIMAQTIGGTNALVLASKVLEQSLQNHQKKLLIDTGWPNHPKIFSHFEIINYEHESPETRTYNHDIYIAKLKNHPIGSPVLLQTGGFNDDGTERSENQWSEILEIVVSRKLIPIFDFAYNGLVNGWEKDAFPVHLFIKKGVIIFVCASNSKNVAYNARLGSLYIVNVDKKYTNNIQDSLSNKIIRPQYSNPPAFAAQVFAKILTDDTLRKQYQDEVTDIRINLLDKNRQILADVLGSKYHWIKEKRGMFLKLIPSGFSDEQVSFLKEKHAIHGPKSSRLNMGGFDPKKMRQIAKIYKDTLSL